MSNVGIWISGLIISIVLLWVVWRQPWLGLPRGFSLKILKLATVWVFLVFVLTLTFELLDIKMSTWKYVLEATLIIIFFIIIPILLLAAKRFEKLKRNSDIPLIIEPANQDSIPILFMKQNLTFRNKLYMEVVVKASTKADREHPEFTKLTELNKYETKVVENAVLAGQRFYIFTAKALKSTESDGDLFVREYAEKDLEELNWTVVLEPGYSVLKYS